jgi:ligand-binding SRPBCC domain-containing protein
MNIDDPGGFEVGDEFSARLWFLIVIPGWRHHLRIVEDGDLELYTNERSGPARIWNHRLTFKPIDDSSCTYTDEVEVEGGVLGRATALFVKIFFRYRHWRWRKLVR